MAKIVEMIDDLKLNKEILGRKKAYINIWMYRLDIWKAFMKDALGITHVEDIKPLHIKRYIQERQSAGNENNSTINNSVATIKVFFQYLVDEEVIEEQENPMRRIKNLKEEKPVIVTFNDG